MKCPYCTQERENLDGWHDCQGARDAKARVDQHVDDLIRLATNRTERQPEPIDDMTIGRTIKNMKAYDDDREN